ncbi:VCBS domain-containing protein [Kordiimonas lacus]|uniref:VCBS repeat-containing protein n=1 Tax=Kordiimonas lacus TaxID=637679 RepID=A0A1G6U1R1_9PROT|nr:VCBS domain-containing protein [Kordiimonas lacus]SDD34547.1 VCBS repeat-containing protein [Kordiimonas lacus]
MPKGGNGGVDNGTDDDDVIEATENKINGGDGDDVIVGTGNADRVNAGDGDDTVTGGAGDDTLYGNDGSNTAVFSGDVRDYTFEDGRGNAFIVSGDDGTDTLKHFDRLVFDNFTIDLTGNNAPLVDDHAMTVSEDGDGSLDLLAGAWDYEGDEMTVTGASAGSLDGSSLTYDAAGSFDYLAVGETAEVVVDYTVSDGTDSSAGSVTVTVEGANDGPVAADDAGSTDENTAITMDVLANDTDVDLSDTHTVDSVSVSSGGGTASIVGNQVQWDPGSDYDYLAAGESAVVELSYSMSDNNGGTSDATATITVNGVNDAPEFAGGDSGSVTAVAVEPDAGEAGPLVFTVEQYTGFQSNNLATLQNYAATHAANYVGETEVIDFTDDPGGFAGEIPGSNPWPAAAATGSSGTGGINDVFFARITTDFSVSEADTYTFRTFNDDGVFLMVDGQLIISDTGYHPEAPFEGSIALSPGDHSLELFFFEYGGEASLELSVRDSSGSYELLGAAGGLAGSANALLTDSGTLDFSDADLSDGHSVSVADGGAGYLGTFVATISDPSQGDGSGQVSWDFTVDNDALVALGEGESLTQTYDVTVSDGNGGEATETVTITMVGTNEAPVVSGVGTTGEVTEDSGDGQVATGTVEATDADASDDLDWSGDAVGTYGTLTVDADGNWEYTLDNSNPDVQALDGDSDPLQDVFTLTVSDGISDATEEVMITINGTDEPEIPEISEGNLEAGSSAIGSVAQAGWYNSADPDHSDFWYVALEAGTVVTIQVDRLESALDPALFIFQGVIDDPLATFGTNIDFNSEPGYIGFADDEIWRSDGPFGDPLFTFTVQETGMYTFIVTNYLSGGDHGGDFQFDYQISVDVD